MQEKTSWKKAFYLALMASLVFWAIDWLSHVVGGSETTFYHVSKLFNSILFAWLLFRFFWPKLKASWIARGTASIVFGLYVSVYYALASYSTGFVQSLGITALRTPPTFFAMTPYLWGPAHMIYFFIGIHAALFMEKTIKGGE